MTIFVAGATGPIGRALLPVLLDEGQDVAAMRRSPDGAGGSKSLRIKPVVCDVLDADAVRSRSCKQSRRW